MSTPSAHPDPADLPPVPDTAMHSGSDDGEPGEHLPEPALTDRDRAVLAELSRPAPPVVSAVEDSAETVGAVEDDSPLPVRPPDDGDDPRDPVFQEPV